MAENHIPPSHQSGADGGSGDASVPDRTPNSWSRQRGQHDSGVSWGAHARMAQEYWGSNRQGKGEGGQGRGGYSHQNDLVTERSDLYHQDDIHRHFWGREADPRDEYGSTFHGSKDHSDSLSYLLLYSGANPRWANDQIVFAKSKLALLPEYASKKAENRGWAVMEKASTGSEATTDSKAPAIDAPDGQGFKAEMQAASAKSQAPSHPSANEPDSGKDATAPIHAAGPAAGENQPEPDVGEGKDMQHGENRPDQALTTKTPESKSPTNTIDGQAEKSASDKSAASEKQKSQNVDAGREAVAADAGLNTDVPTSSFTLVSRPKYPDIRKEETQAASQLIGQDDQAGHTDSHAVPTSGPSNNTNNNSHEAIAPQPPLFPAMPPIDYTPGDAKPIAIFEEHRAPGAHKPGQYSRFAFKGWFTIARINILAPQSAEVVRMLQQKWERRDRQGNVKPSAPRKLAAWNHSLAQEWAVVKFARLDAPLQAPLIERVVAVLLPRPEPPAVVGQEKKDDDETTTPSKDTRELWWAYAREKAEASKTRRRDRNKLRSETRERTDGGNGMDEEGYDGDAERKKEL